MPFIKLCTVIHTFRSSKSIDSMNAQNSLFLLSSYVQWFILSDRQSLLIQWTHRTPYSFYQAMYSDSYFQIVKVYWFNERTELLIPFIKLCTVIHTFRSSKSVDSMNAQNSLFLLSSYVQWFILSDRQSLLIQWTHRTPYSFYQAMYSDSYFQIVKVCWFNERTELLPFIKLCTVIHTFRSSKSIDSMNAQNSFFLLSSYVQWFILSDRQSLLIQWTHRTPSSFYQAMYSDSYFQSVKVYWFNERTELLLVLGYEVFLACWPCSNLLF